MSSTTIVQFPEELLERILFLYISSTTSSARPEWHRSPSQSSLTPLLISKQFSRIATPLFYNSIHLSSPHTARLLLATLRSNPARAAHIRCLSLAGVWRDAAHIMRLAGPAVRVLDLNITLDDDDNNANTNQFYAESLVQMTGVQHLTLRKPTNVYLSLPRPRYLISALACAISNGWSDLQSANIAFKLSDDTPTSPILNSNPTFAPFSVPSKSPPTSPISNNGPISSLTHALASAPHLHTFATHLPAVWNISILAVAANPALQRIVLTRPGASPTPLATSPHAFTASCVHGPAAAAGCNYHHPQQQGIIGTGLFLMEARKYPRLGELIRAGTPIIRTRAQTLGTPSPSQSPSPSLSSAPLSPEGRKAATMPVGVGLGIDMGSANARRW